MTRTPLIALMLALAFPAQAAEQPVDWQWDEGVGYGALVPGNKPELPIGSVVAAGFWTEHAAIVDSLQLGFWGGAGIPCNVRILRDNGGNQPGLPEGGLSNDPGSDRMTPKVLKSKANGEWVTVDVSQEKVLIPPWTWFWVGIEVTQPGVNLAIDATKIVANDPRDPHAYIWTPKVEPCDQGCIAAGWDLLVRVKGRYLDAVDPGQRWFADVTKQAGVEPAGRMAWGDYDNDGDDDLLSGGGARLWKNDGKGVFVEVTKEAKLEGLGSGGGLWGDYDNDGWLDIFVYGGKERLLHNEGNGTFKVASIDFTESKDRDFPTESAIWLDYDQDGWLDLYTANYETVKKDANGNDLLGICDPDFLWRNLGNGQFQRMDGVLQKALGATNKMCGRGLAAADYDQDGDVDLFVNNYRLKPNFFLLNDGQGGFSEIAAKNGTKGSGKQGSFGHGTGTQWVDADNDGDFDLFVANLAHPRFIQFSDRSRFFQNRGGVNDWNLTEHREATGIGYLETHSEARFGDYDNDGDLDLAIGAYYGDRAGQLWRNDGPTGDDTSWLHFTDTTYDAGWLVKGCASIAWADIDGDGDLDQMANKLFRNDFVQKASGSGHWLKVKLAGTKLVNRAAIGATVTLVTADGRTMTRQVEGGHGIGCQDSLVLHFGLGAATEVKSLTVRWPGELPVAVAGPFAADQTVVWSEGHESQGKKPGAVAPQPDAGSTDAIPSPDAAPDAKPDVAQPQPANPKPPTDDGCTANSRPSAAWTGLVGLLLAVGSLVRRRRVA
jgi:hypothetical protein